LNRFLVFLALGLLFWCIFNVWHQIRERIKSNLADTRGDVLSRAKKHNEDLRETFKRHDHSVHKTDERSVGSDRTAEQHDNKAERSVGKVREHISELADKFGRETSIKLRELTASVKQFGEKAIAKVKEVAIKVEKSYSQSFGRGGMSR
jgi:Skp family chaperone for outer membrane proteins